VGVFETESAAQAIRKCGILHPHLFRFQLPDSHLSRINSQLNIGVITQALFPSSLLEIYDVILDCADNAPTRYLLSDTAVPLGKPLVSGAAEKYQGQLCTYNLGKNGMCYRCLFPNPAPPEQCHARMVALETIKIITGLHGAALLNSLQK
jgi:adenylyltransferase/sulfurtransferase